MENTINTAFESLPKADGREDFVTKGIEQYTASIPSSMYLAVALGAMALSLTMEVEFCVEALKRALRRGRPEIFNSDQGSQFTSEKFTGELVGRQIAISMDGRGRCLDNIFVERLWRSLKYEEVYLKDYASVSEARAGIARYFQFYNHERLHQSLDYRTPAEIYLLA